MATPSPGTVNSRGQEQPSPDIHINGDGRPVALDLGVTYDRPDEEYVKHISTRVAKKFDDGFIYVGTVESFEKEDRLLRVVFDDGDDETWDLDDIAEGIEEFGREDWKHQSHSAGGVGRKQTRQQEDIGGTSVEEVVGGRSEENNVDAHEAFDAETGVHKCCIGASYHEERDKRYARSDCRLKDIKCSGGREDCLGDLIPGDFSPVYICRKYWNRKSYDSWGRADCKNAHLCMNCFEAMKGESEQGTAEKRGRKRGGAAGPTGKRKRH
mmetsp:Transcript_24279/g.52906  ORF Transcript_24279/g.52906 Transcript_24279/m.52906 type:complete len:268 (-) Transcript_24279:92-895(-)